MKYIYGPVKSRRLGFSLGISLTPYKTCSFDCLYCQLGKTTVRTASRQEYVKTTDILDELKSWLENNPEDSKQLNFITFSGAGEPTLHSKIGELISGIKKMTDIPVAVITNASLLSEPAVRKEILAADLIVPSLDAVTPQIFAKIDQPHPQIQLEKIIEGLIALRREFKGKIWLEVMLVKGVNDRINHIRLLKETIDKINPNKVQLNSPVRASCQQNVLAVGKAKLRKIKQTLAREVEIF